MLKTIFTNTAAQLIAKFVAVLLTFITTAMIIRSGGPSLFGDLTKVLSLVAIGFTAIDFGLNAEAVREMTGPLVSRYRVLSRVFATRLVFSVIIALGLNLSIWLLPGGYTPVVKSVLWLGSLSIIFQGIYTSGNVWFQRHLSYWKSSLITVVGSLVGASLTYLVVVHQLTLFGLLAASTTGYAIMATLTLISLPRPFIPLISFHPKQILTTFRRSLSLGFILLFSIVASKLDTILLGIFRPSAELGQYGFAYRIFDVLLVVPTLAMNSIYPLMVISDGRAKTKLVKNSSLVLLTLGILVFIVTTFAAPLVLLIRPDLKLAASALRILGLATPLFYLTSPLMWQLIERRREKSLLIIYFVAVLFNGLGNFLLIPHYGAIGSAYLTGLTELLILVGLLWARRSS